MVRYTSFVVKCRMLAGSSWMIEKRYSHFGALPFLPLALLSASKLSRKSGCWTAPSHTRYAAHHGCSGAAGRAAGTSGSHAATHHRLSTQVARRGTRPAGRNHEVALPAEGLEAAGVFSFPRPLRRSLRAPGTQQCAARCSHTQNEKGTIIVLVLSP